MGNGFERFPQARADCSTSFFIYMLAFFDCQLVAFLIILLNVKLKNPFSFKY